MCSRYKLNQYDTEADQIQDTRPVASCTLHFHSPDESGDQGPVCPCGNALLSHACPAVGTQVLHVGSAHTWDHTTHPMLPLLCLHLAVDTGARCTPAQTEDTSFLLSCPWWQRLHSRAVPEFIQGPTDGNCIYFTFFKGRGTG